MTHHLTRRAALGLAAGGTCAALAPSPLLAGKDTSTLAARAARLFSNPRHITRVGRSCLRCSALGGNPTRESLVDALFGAERGGLELAGDAEIHGWLRDRVRRDFAAGQTVKVEGWVLARTEALLYALASTV